MWIMDKALPFCANEIDSHTVHETRSDNVCVRSHVPGCTNESVVGDLWTCVGFEQACNSQL